LSLYLLNFTCSAAAAGLLTVFYQKNILLILVLSIPIAIAVYQLYSFYVQRFHDADKHIADLNKLYLQTVETLASAVDAKDRYTHGHIRRVQAFAMELASCMGITGQDELMGMRAGALLHDIGKIAIPVHPEQAGRLDRERIRQNEAAPRDWGKHAEVIEFPFPVIPMVKSHHERWDGNGYPEGLAGEAIPIGARILSLVDCYDALTTNRPYRSQCRERRSSHSFSVSPANLMIPISLRPSWQTCPPRTGRKEVVVDDTDLWGIREQLGKQTVALRPLEKVQPIVTYGKALRGVLSRNVICLRYLNLPAPIFNSWRQRCPVVYG
jgi:hypothetical protein